MLPRIGGVRMTIHLLAGITILLFLLIMGISFLLFGREWLRARREEAFSRNLDRHSDLISRLRTTAGEEFDGVIRQLALVPDPTVREAILDRSRDEASPESSSCFVKAYEDLGIAAHYIKEVEQSEKWEDRARAAERLGRIGSPKAVPALLRVIRNVKDEDGDVRGAALRALGRIRDPRALPSLIEVLGYSEASIPPRIAEIIVMFGKDAIPLLIGELKNFESDVRRMWAAEILGWLGDPRSAISLIESLGDVSPEVRAKAAGGLGKIRDVRAVERLLEMLMSDPIPFVRTRVAQALGAIGHPKVIDHLIHVLKDPEWWVRIRSIEALEQIGKDSFPALLVGLEDDDDEVRRRAAMALERMGYVQECISLLEQEGFRPDIYKVLQLIGKTGVTEVLYDGIRTTKGNGQKLLVRIAGDIGDPAAGPILRGVLAECEDPSLRSRLAEALGKILDRDAIPDLLICLRDPDDWVRRASVEALSALGAEDHATELLRLLKDPVSETRKAVCRVVSRLEGKRMDDAVEALLADPSPVVRAEALRGVQQRKFPGCEPKVRQLLSDPSEEVRLEAAKALSAAGGSESVDEVLRAASGASDRLVEALVAACLRCHEGPFAALLARAPKELSREQAMLLLETAARGTGENRLAFISRYLGVTDPLLRRQAAYALRGIEADKVIDLVEILAQDPDDRVRNAAVAVCALHGSSAFLSVAERLAADPHKEVRLHVALALGISGGKAVRDTLLALGQDREPSVRAGAAMALALQNDPELVSAIRNFSQDEELCSQAREIFVPHSPDLLVPRVVEEALSRNMVETRLFLGGSRFALEKELVQRAREALTAAERVRALEICKVVATGQSYTAALVIVKNDPSPEVRAKALELLVTIRRDSEVARVVGTALLDPYPDIRVKAAWILGEMEFPEALEALVHSLDTPERELREVVTTSLSRHIGRNPKQAEELMVGIPATKTRKLGMIWLLGKTRRGGAMKLLLRYLEDEEGEVRAAAVGALAKYRLGIVARFLRASLSDPNGRVRAAAVNALSRLRSQEWEGVMERMLMDPDSFVRRRAAVALYRMEGKTVRERIRAIAEEPEDLRPVWAAAGLIYGDLTPSSVSAYPDSANFLHELYPLEEANSAIRESLDPKCRLTAFRIQQVLSPDAAMEAARVLEKDPDDNIRKEAMAVLRDRGPI
jgi:HEAT repeat protein